MAIVADEDPEPADTSDVAEQDDAPEPDDDDDAEAEIDIDPDLAKAAA
jgi:hypothetical protein